MSLRCVFLGVCAFLLWVLFHFGPGGESFFLLLFVVFGGVSEIESRWIRRCIKEARSLQPPEITTHSMHTPFAPIFCVALFFLTNDESRPTSSTPTFIPNHAAPRGLAQLKNERAEGEQDTLRSNHVPAGITPPTLTTPSSACMPFVPLPVLLPPTCRLVLVLVLV